MVKSHAHRHYHYQVQILRSFLIIQILFLKVKVKEKTILIGQSQSLIGHQPSNQISSFFLSPFSIFLLFYSIHASENSEYDFRTLKKFQNLYFCIFKSRTNELGQWFLWRHKLDMGDKQISRVIKPLHFHDFEWFLYVLSRMENFRQKFDSYTTSEEVMADADVKGKTYLVTGASTGLG